MKLMLQYYVQCMFGTEQIQGVNFGTSTA